MRKEIEKINPIKLEKAALKSNKPLLYIDVDIGEDEPERIVVYQNDNPHKLASDFCKKHGIIDEETATILEEQLKEKIKKVEQE